MTDRISGSAFKQMIAFGAACVAQQKQAINDLNVFPVPDGDTGTNMSLTIQTAVNELKKSEPATVGEAAKITAGALLRGARGNSGVILSLLFRGISKSAKGLVEMDGPALAAAMGEGVATAYGAVMKPAEGTVLTVSRLAAARAAQAAQENPSAEYVLEQAIAAGQETLAQTIDMNPVLKKAGVVDAGGKGYLIILDGMLRALRGEELPQVEEDEKAQDKADFGALSLEDITFTYDTVFIVRKKEGVSIEPFRAYLDGIGDSLVFGEDDEAFKVHVHTDIPGQALTEAAKYGTLELAKIENMRTQAEELAAGKQAQSTDDLDAVEEELEAMEGGVAAPEKRYGFLAVCAGDGLAATFRDLGVDRIVSGGQTMNPLHPGHFAGGEPHPQRGGVRAAQQQEHHHGRPAVRGPDGKRGHRGAHQHRAPGDLRHDGGGPGGGRSPGDPGGHDGGGGERGHRPGDLCRPELRFRRLRHQRRGLSGPDGREAVRHGSEAGDPAGSAGGSGGGQGRGVHHRVLWRRRHPGGRPAGRAALCGCLPGGGGVPAPRRPACVLLYYLN